VLLVPVALFSLGVVSALGGHVVAGILIVVLGASFLGVGIWVRSGEVRLSRRGCELDATVENIWFIDVEGARASIGVDVVARLPNGAFQPRRVRARVSAHLATRIASGTSLRIFVDPDDPGSEVAIVEIRGSRGVDVPQNSPMQIHALVCPRCGAGIDEVVDGAVMCRYCGVRSKLGAGGAS
jgi:hypothetical protein